MTILYILFLNFSSSLTTGKIQEKNIQEAVATGNKIDDQQDYLGKWHLYNDIIVANIDIVDDDYIEFDISFVCEE